MSRARERPGYSIAGPKLRQERLSFSLQALRSRGEVVNAAVCKTAMHGCESHRDLKIDDDRLYACDMFPIDLLTILCRIFMSGQEHDARRHVAVSERNPQGRRHANTGGDPRNNFGVYPRLAKASSSSPPPAEHERIARFQPDDAFPCRDSRISNSLISACRGDGVPPLLPTLNHSFAP
jgi:hypothetical protein